MNKHGAMLAKPYRLRSWRSAAVGAALFLACLYIFAIPRHSLDNAYFYPRYIYNGISNFVADRVYENTLYRPGNEHQVHRQWNFSNPCRDFPDTSDILLVMKTGATEVFDKLPTHLLTALQCMPDFLLFSDMEQQIGQWHVHDVLSAVDPDIKETHLEFGLYKAQVECPVSQKDCVKSRGKNSIAWALDKYKFLHMIKRAWDMRPNRAWYVFTEADTYVFWPNLVTYLRNHLDANEKLYVGSITLINNMPFAHGGSGYVVSGVLIKSLLENRPDIAREFDKRAPESCCGDLMLALAFEENEGVRVRQAHPMFNGEKPISLPFGPGHWCEPILTMHHMNPEEISAVWQYEQTRTSNNIIIMRDLYQTFVKRHLQDRRDDWDNLSDDTCYINQDPSILGSADPIFKSRQKPLDSLSFVEESAHKSPEDCARVCEFEGYVLEDDLPALTTDGAPPPTNHDLQMVLRAQERRHEHDRAFKLNRRCFQWRYNNGVCCTSKSFKLGLPRFSEERRPQWHSGWFMKGINDWETAADTCAVPAWKAI